MGDILIKGMEMPKETYAHCMLIKDIDGSVQLHVCTKNGEDVSEWEYYDLVPIPPHGRLGDLDKLVEKIDGIWDCNDMVFKPNDHCCNIPEDCKGCKWVETKNFIRRIVANAPTIIPASEEGES